MLGMNSDGIERDDVAVSRVDRIDLGHGVPPSPGALSYWLVVETVTATSFGGRKI